MFEYGTAGFRADAGLLHNVMLRCGMLMAARGLHGGIMITASHNIDTDNGVKLVDENGEMISKLWEERATILVNAATTEIDALLREWTTSGERPNIYIGYDTRASSVAFSELCACGVRYGGGNAIIVGCVTTPELHHHVLTRGNVPFVDSLLNAFFSIYEGVKECHVDCANGVGAITLLKMAPELEKKGVKLNLYNTGQGRLNWECGSDYVEKERRFPCGMNGGVIPEGSICFSIDGDGDRIVCFTRKGEELVLLNGDKIAALYASVLGKEYSGANIGIVQTAYANGAATRFLEEKYKVVCAKTGVKNLHHEAKKFDIGVYFEANGHGTVLFHDGGIPYKALLSQVTGDAIGNLLMILYGISCIKNGFNGWQDMYDDLPCVQEKVRTDRNAFVTEDADRVCVLPEGLQTVINREMAKYENGRAFVRPSGTEDIVRIYAEAARYEDALNMSDVIKRWIEEAVVFC